MADMYIGFDIDSKKTVACAVQEGRRDQYTTLRTDLVQMQQYLQQQRQDGRPVHLTQLLEELKLLTDRLKQVTGYLDRYLDRQPGGTLLMSIPGVGPRTAEAIMAYTDDVQRFKRSKQYGAYFGLTPKLDESGQTRRLGHISKAGPSVVRWLLTESVWRAIQKSPALAAFYQRVAAGQKQRKKIAVVATARKLLTIMRAMPQTGELFNEQLVAANTGADKQPVNPLNN
jgi:transposase